MKNPVMTASGTFGYGLEFQDFVNLEFLPLKFEYFIIEKLNLQKNIILLFLHFKLFLSFYLQIFVFYYPFV